MGVTHKGGQDALRSNDVIPMPIIRREPIEKELVKLDNRITRQDPQRAEADQAFCEEHRIGWKGGFVWLRSDFGILSLATLIHRHAYFSAPFEKQQKPQDK